MENIVNNNNESSKHNGIKEAIFLLTHYGILVGLFSGVVYIWLLLEWG